jgi:hypothetical protein
MATLLEELQKVQPCDGRSLIQLMTQRAIQEITRLKRQACEEVANTFSTYGLENIYPCDYLTEEFLEKLITAEPTEAISSALLRAGYPPHLLKAFIQGFDELSDEELQEMLEWTQPRTGIRIHPNTSKYFRTETTTTLSTSITELVTTRTRQITRDLTPAELVNLREDRKNKQQQEQEVAAEKQREEFFETVRKADPRALELILGEGPKITLEEYKGGVFDSLVTEYIRESQSNKYMSEEVFNSYSILSKPVNEGGFGETSYVWGYGTYGFGVGGELGEVTVTASALPQETPTVTETETFTETEEIVTTEEITTTTSILSEYEAKEVREFYLNQGIGNVVLFLAQSLGTEVNSLLQCPTPETTQKLVTRVTNLARIVNSVKQTINTLQQIVNVTSAIFNLLSRIVDILKKVIIAAQPAIIAAALIPFTAGIAAILNKIVGATRGIITKYEPEIEKLDKQICAAASSLTFVVANINVVDAFIRVIDELLRNCIQELSDSGDALSTAVASALTPITGNPRGSGDIEYRGYKIEVRTKASDNTLKQRYAVGIDLNGVVAIEGPLSYSADAEILIEELKYRIDTYLG